MKRLNLTNIGLSENEIELYKLLLERGEVPAGELLKSTKLKRATLYDTLNQLISKRLVTKNNKGKKTLFAPESPTRLTEYSNKQLETLQRAKNEIEANLPEFLSLYTLNIGKPVIQYFEGIEGIKTLCRDSLIENKPILSIVQSRRLPPELYKWLHSFYKKERIKKGITRTIINSGTWTEGFIGNDPEDLRQSKIVEEEKFGFKNELNIYGNKVAIINTSEDNKLIGILINDPLIAATLRSWFELTWSKL